MTSLRLLAITVFTQTLFSIASSSLAFAANDTPLAILRQEFRSPNPVEIQGSLTGSTGCEVNRRPASAESFPPCTLEVRDAKSGQNYKIQSNTWIADDAQTLYQAGVRNVSIQGHVTGADTLNAESIEKSN